MSIASIVLRGFGTSSYADVFKLPTLGYSSSPGNPSFPGSATLAGTGVASASLAGTGVSSASLSNKGPSRATLTTRTS